MLRDYLNNFIVEGLSLLRMLLAQPVRFLEPVSHLVVEIDLLPELQEVLVLDFLVYVASDLFLSCANLDLRFNLVNNAIFVEIIIGVVSLWILDCSLKVGNKNILLHVVLVINSVF